jgi:hypothetical protein
MAVHGTSPSVRNDASVAAGMAAAIQWVQATPHRTAETDFPSRPHHLEVPMSKLIVCSLTALASFALMGCAPDAEEDFATAVVSSALETPNKQNGAREIVDTADCELSAADAASEAAARPTVGLYPSSCVQKTADGASVHAQLDGCTGAFGKVELNGGLDAALEVTGECKLRADIVDSGDLSANGRELTYDATADIELLDGARDVTWNAHWIGSTRRGREIEQTSQLRVLIDDASHCLNVEGSAEGHVAQYDYGWEASGLSVCPDACPSAGSVRAHWQGRARDREISVEFDGSNVAHVVGWSGSEFDVEMVCAGTEPAPTE